MKLIHDTTEYMILAKKFKSEDETDDSYCRVTGSFESEYLCRKRFESDMQKGRIMDYLDISTAKLVKRNTKTYASEWETVDTGKENIIVK